MSSCPDFATPTADSLSVGKVSFNINLFWSTFKTSGTPAIARLYNDHVHGLYDYGMHMCGNHSIVIDSLHGLFSKLLKIRISISGPKSLKCYLFKSFRRRLIRHIIENGESLTQLREAKPFEWASSLESGQIENEPTGVINSIHSLTKDHREVIYLKFQTGLTYSEIAEITKLHIDTVYDLVSKALGLISKEVQVSKHPMPLL